MCKNLVALKTKIEKVPGNSCAHLVICDEGAKLAVGKIKGVVNY
jgi:hypothetical protein